jgi:ERF superfamily
MQQSSETIGAIASALAKAQAELTNPEKALVATIRASNPREKDQIFRYAALSSGLDIVRKALGGHEIATVQTTAIDKEAGLIRLTTTLAHSSGEWLSSEWPVCPIAETAAPRRMGAALTYARRYALFTLVGIAGEDDLDAPELGAAGNSDTKPSVDIQTSTKPVADELSFAPSGASRKGKVIRPPRIVLATDQSKALRDRLVAELSDLKSADEAADWVHKNLPARNILAPADAETVEASFRERLATIEGGQSTAASEQNNSGDEPSREQSRAFDSPETPAPETTVVRHRRIAAKTIRLRDKEHCRLVATQPCVACGRTPAEAHHIRFAQPRALNRKVSDEYTVPVCRVHHRELHRYGDEASWWAGVGIDPLPIALELWRRSRLTYSLAATSSETFSDAIPPPAAKVRQAPLDGDARDRIDVADCVRGDLEVGTSRAAL